MWCSFPDCLLMLVPWECCGKPLRHHFQNFQTQLSAALCRSLHPPAISPSETPRSPSTHLLYIADTLQGKLGLSKAGFAGGEIEGVDTLPLGLDKARLGSQQCSNPQ